MKETAAQILLRTALRFYKIRDLEMPEIKRLMVLSEEEFEHEYAKMLSLRVDEHWSTNLEAYTHDSTCKVFIC